MATDRIEQQLECPICFDRFRTPKMLPCQHLFCLECLQHIAQRSPEIRCPECRASHSIPSNGVSGFPTSIAMQRILEASNPPNVPSPSTSHENAPAHQTIATSRQTHRELHSNRPGYTTPGVVISPSAPPVHNTAQQTNEDVEMQLALEISLDEQRRSTANVQGNRNRPSVFTHVQGSSNLRTNRNQDRASYNNGNLRIVSRNVRQTLRGLAGRILNDHKTLLSAFIVTFSVVTFSRFVAGATKLSSDCQPERHAAVYLFVKACFASLFWGVLVVWICKENLERALDNIFVEVYMVLESLFSICWLFVGTAWIMGNFYLINNQCPEYVRNWNAHFINFGLFLTVVDYIGLIVFLFYSGYTLCDSDEENQ